MKNIIQKLIDSKFGIVFFIILSLFIGLIKSIFNYKKFTEFVKENNSKPVEIIYLEKNDDYIKISKDNEWLNIEEGNFYSYSAKRIEGNETSDLAKIKLFEIVEKYKQDGYLEKEFKENPQNSISKYDDFDWHEVSDNVNEFNAHIPFGFLLGFMIEENLLSKRYEKNKFVNLPISSGM